MKPHCLLTPILLALLLGITACRDKDSVNPKVQHENRFVRLLVSDDAGTGLTLVNPSKNETEAFEASLAGSTLYPTASGRFAAVLNNAGNSLQFFDSGLEAHGDHVDLKGTPKWAKTTGDAPKPTHFHAWGNQLAVFNDGDGSLSLAFEDQLHTADKATHLVVARPHHGAVILFDNGTIAVTEKDNSVAGSLPERVRTVDRSGNQVYPSVVATGGIHGEAGDGKSALFGSTSGVLRVSSDGSQSLIPYPSHFGTNWLSTISYGASAKRFIGYRSRFGVYFVNPEQNTVTPILEDEHLLAARFDHQGQDLLVLEDEGTLSIFDGTTGARKAQRTLSGLVFPEKGSRPAVNATKKYVYVSNPERGQLLMLEKATLADFRTFSLPGKPAKFALVGADIDEEGGHQ